jgi:riboflavin biosynthesis pyrimidine reductase
MHPADGHDVLLASSNRELLVAASEKTGIECIELKEGLPLAQQLVQSLGALGLTRVLLEGGPELIRAFVFDQLIDEVHLTVTLTSTELSPEEARSIVSSISYLPNANDTLAVSFDGENNYLVWFPSGVAA